MAFKSTLDDIVSLESTIAHHMTIWQLTTNNDN